MPFDRATDRSVDRRRDRRGRASFFFFLARPSLPPPLSPRSRFVPTRPSRIFAITITIARSCVRETQDMRASPGGATKARACEIPLSRVNGRVRASRTNWKRAFCLRERNMRGSARDFLSTRFCTLVRAYRRAFRRARN